MAFPGHGDCSESTRWSNAARDVLGSMAGDMRLGSVEPFPVLVWVHSLYRRADLPQGCGGASKRVAADKPLPASIAARSPPIGTTVGITIIEFAPIAATIAIAAPMVAAIVASMAAPMVA